MLRLTDEQLDWVLTQQRERLAHALGQVLLKQWPDLAAKLGDRSAVFVDSALQQAQRHGLRQATHAARYVNLWCVWGPAFDDKPGFEWAADILRDARRTSAVKIQQLILQSREVLAKRPASGLEPKAFDAADTAMEAVPKAVAVAAWIEGTEMAQAEPRQPCDLTGFDLVLGEQSWRHEYRLAWNGQAVLAQHMPYVPPPQRYRTDQPVPPGTPVLPRQVAALADSPQRGHKAWLHLRCETEAVCDEHKHPRVEIKTNPLGRVFEGRAARLIKWPLHYTATDVGAGMNASMAGLCHEPQARYLMLSAATCGLRQLGAPLGQQEAQLSIYPAEQWLADFITVPQPVLQWPTTGAHETAALARIRLECDTRSQPTAAWEADWAKLTPALVQGVDTWFNALLRLEQLGNTRLSVEPQLMHGQATWTWGAREAITADGSVGFLRTAAFIRMVACASKVALQTELKHGGAHARIHLQATGQAEMTHDVLREAPVPLLPDTLATLKVQWRFPWTARVESLSSPQLATLHADDSSPLGALVGEAGLRPRPDGRGWQWYCQLKLEPATLRLMLTDPLLGQASVHQPLWPALVLLDWSAG
jgi:hypothetical protein